MQLVLREKFIMSRSGGVLKYNKHYMSIKLLLLTATERVNQMIKQVPYLPENFDKILIFYEF